MKPMFGCAKDAAVERSCRAGVELLLGRSLAALGMTVLFRMTFLSLG
jgi:hypothetical protein